MNQTAKTPKKNRISIVLPPFFALFICSTFFLAGQEAAPLHDRSAEAVLFDSFHGYHSRLSLRSHFNKTSSITTGVFALMECFNPAVMWTQVPA